MDRQLWVIDVILPYMRIITVISIITHNKDRVLRYSLQHEWRRLKINNSVYGYM